MAKKTRKKKVIPESPASLTVENNTIASSENGIEIPTQTTVEIEEKPKTRVVYKTDARYEILKDSLAELVKRRPEAGAVQRNPMLYHEWALELERLLQ